MLIWFQEAAGEIWIGLVKNIIDNIVNEPKNRPCACIRKWADIWNILKNFRLLQK